MRRNSVLDGLRSNLLEFIQESMSEKVLESISSEEVEFEGVKEMYIVELLPEYCTRMLLSAELISAYPRNAYL